MRFAAQQHHEMTRLLRRKAAKQPDPAATRAKSNSFLALAKAASRQGQSEEPLAPPKLRAVAPVAPPKPPTPAA
jgi:hypothetical protein